MAENFFGTGMLETMDVLKKYRYEAIALITGASVMTLEIVGGRLIAPFFGLSTHVWTAMIGVILASLSLGYWIGGRAADRDDVKADIPMLLTVAAAGVFIMSLFQKPVLELIADAELDLRFSAILAAIVLFSLPSAFIGMVSPHLAKVRIRSLKNSGATVGRLEAAGAVGSICGTFLSGYFLLEYFGSWHISLGIAAVLVATSFIAEGENLKLTRILLLVGIVGLLITSSTPTGATTLADIDSSYARYQIKESVIDGKRARLLVMDSYGTQSAYFPDEPNTPALTYAKKITSAVKDFNAQQIVERTLIIGGGAHTLPAVFQESFPQMSIDVVEIDPKMDMIAEKYFSFKKKPQTNLYYEDGRTFLNKNSATYDLIIVDAYSSLTPPFQLTTRETVERLYESLDDEGLLIANVVSRKKDGLLDDVRATYESVFKSSRTFTVQNVNDDYIRQNFLLVAARNWSVADAVKIPNEFNSKGSGKVFTDDFAPVEAKSY